MTGIDDLELHRGSTMVEPPRRPLWPWLALVVVLALAGGTGFWAYRRYGPSAPPAPPAPRLPRAPLEAPPALAPASQPLPPLDASDAFVRELIARLSAHPRLLEWLATSELIRTAARVVDRVAEGASPAAALPFLRPAQPFRALERGGVWIADPRNAQRYDVVGDVVASLDAAGCAQLLRTLQPLLEQAYRELDHPDGGFDAALGLAFRRLILTPLSQPEAGLQPSGKIYVFRNSALERLSPVEKQFLGLGARNQRLVQAKLRQIAAAAQLAW
jgi:hypothetical protein